MRQPGTLALLALLAVPAAAQHGGRTILPPEAIAEFPTCDGSETGLLYDGVLKVATDGATSSDCTTGGGTEIVACVCDSSIGWRASVVSLDHGALSGLADDDHPQYFLHTELDTLAEVESAAGEGLATQAELDALDLRDLPSVTLLGETDGDVLQYILGGWSNVRLGLSNLYNVDLTDAEAGDMLVYNGAGTWEDRDGGCLDTDGDGCEVQTYETEADTTYRLDVRVTGNGTTSPSASLELAGTGGANHSLSLNPRPDLGGTYGFSVLPNAVYLPTTVSLGWWGDTDTGLSRPATDSVALLAGGQHLVQATSNGTSGTTVVRGLGTQAATVFEIDVTGDSSADFAVSSAGQLRAGAGTTSGYTFLGDTTSGVFSYSGGLGLRGGGSGNLFLTAAMTEVNIPLRVLAGTEASPFIVHQPSVDGSATGIHFPATDVLAISANGDTALTIAENDVTVEGELAVLQDGGVAGTDELALWHDGSLGYVRSRDGHLDITASASAGEVRIRSGSAAAVVLYPANGSAAWTAGSSYFGASSGARIYHAAPSLTSPSLVPAGGDTDTGIGADGSNTVSLVAGGQGVLEADTDGTSNVVRARARGTQVAPIFEAYDSGGTLVASVNAGATPRFSADSTGATAYRATTSSTSAYSGYELFTGGTDWGLYAGGAAHTLGNGVGFYDWGAGAYRLTLTATALTVSAGTNLVLAGPTVPSAATDACTAGTLSPDAAAGYLYLCLSSGDWRRVQLSTW